MCRLCKSTNMTTEAKEEIEQLVSLYNSTKTERIKPGLEGELFRAVICCICFKTFVVISN